MTQFTPCDCEYCRPITRIEPTRGPLVAAFEPRHEWSEDRLPPTHSTYLHAGAGVVWPNTTKQADPEPRITRDLMAKAVETARREGYDAGNEAGYEIGYDHGYSQGTDDGFSDGVADGYDEGFEDGFADGYDDGSGAVWIEGWGRVS